MGKSRMLQVLDERLAGAPHARLRYQCSPYYSSTAFYPLITQIEHASGFTRDDTSEQKLDKLEAALAQGTPERPLPSGEGLGEGRAPAPVPASRREPEEGFARTCALIAAMLSLPVDRYPPLTLSPQKQKELTITALAEQVVGLAAQQPVQPPIAIRGNRIGSRLCRSSCSSEKANQLSGCGRHRPGAGRR